MKRRSIISIAGGVTLGAALPLLAQMPPKVYRIGVLTRGVPRAYFLLPAALAALGYEEGRNIMFDYRSAEGQPERVPALAADLVAQNVDLIVAISNTEVAAAKRAAAIADRILKGAKPADIPVEQPTKMDFAINLKTAKAMGLTIPQSVRFQATEVIE